MKFSHFFIDRPVFAAVVSVIITLIGAFAYPALPIAQYPEIAPPTVTVTALYPGASAEVIADTVATPLEQEINGVEDMLYMSSSSTGDGRLTITITFKLGADLDNAQVLVQNRVASAEARLPEEVRRLGVTVRKASPDLMLVIHLFSPDGSRSSEYISNYASLHLRDRLARLEGVGDARVFGARDYAMRVWLDPDKAAAHGLTAGEIVAALRAQNTQVAAGAIGQPPFGPEGPAFQLNVSTQGRLSHPSQFEEVILKADEGRVVRVRDVARVELGAQDYTLNAYLDDGQRAVAIGIFQRPGSNALATAERVLDTVEEASREFPPGLKHTVVYNPTEYVAESIHEVQKTLLEAVVLVALVVIVFLQTWRAAIIPVLAIPVSLIGTFAIMSALGASLNNLSLFGLVLAIGIVVDDAIVVVENVERLLEEGMSPHDAAYKTMDEVGGALIAIALVLISVFVPTAFIAGISGQFYRQFALTIASATAISLIASLTLSPALAAMILRRPSRPCAHQPRGWRKPFIWAGNAFNRGFAWLSDRYGRLTAVTVRRGGIMLAVYLVLLGLTAWRFQATPTGFIPAQDQGYFICVIQLPPGSSLARTDAVVKQVSKIALAEQGVAHTAAFTGLDGATFTNAPNAGTVFFAMDSFESREEHGIRAQALLDTLRRKLAGVGAANVLVIPPPPVRGIGTGGGWKMIIEDRGGAGYRALEAATTDLMVQGNQTPGLASVFTLFNTSTPRIYADIDRSKAELVGVPPERVFETLSVYLGSAFVNDFNFLGRTYRVTAQADAPFRDDAADIARLQTRSDSGEMVPIGTVANVLDSSGPYRVVRYNLHPAAELQGDTAPGYSSGQALAAAERLARDRLPTGFDFEWTELAFQQRAAGATGTIAFGLAVVFVFLLLAAQYESVTLPLAIILIVPMCLLAAILGVNLRGQDNNILTQIGLVVLIGLAAKNAILIVEFAHQNEKHGMSRWDAAVQASHTRLRPILMTSFAFIFGVLPLVVASGPGAEMRQALGTAVFFGMLGVTVFGLLFTPVFYVVCRWLSDRLPKPRRGSGAEAAKAEEPAE